MKMPPFPSLLSMQEDQLVALAELICDIAFMVSQNKILLIEMYANQVCRWQYYFKFAFMYCSHFKRKVYQQIFLKKSRSNIGNDYIFR